MIYFREPVNFREEHVYVAPGVDPERFQKEKSDKWLIKGFDFGTNGIGYYEIGKLKPLDATRPNLLLGKPRNHYAAAVATACSAYKNSRFYNNQEIWKQFPKTVVHTTFVATNVAGIIKGYSWNVLAKSALAGVVVGLMGVIYDKQDYERYYWDVINTTVFLRDMLEYLHSGNTVSWMQNRDSVKMYHRCAPTLFEQGTAELMRIGREVPWAAQFPPRQIVFDEMHVVEVDEPSDAQAEGLNKASAAVAA